MASLSEEIITESKVLKTKRARSKNFDFTEKDRLIEYASKHRTLIESKLTNSVTVQKKRKCWSDIQEKINSLGHAQRSVTDLKTKWSNIVQKAKKEKVELDNYRKGTGGGAPPAPLSQSTEKVLELFSDSPAFNGLVGIESSFKPDITVYLN